MGIPLHVVQPSRVTRLAAASPKLSPADAPPRPSGAGRGKLQRHTEFLPPSAIGRREATKRKPRRLGPQIAHRPILRAQSTSRQHVQTPKPTHDGQNNTKLRQSPHVPFAAPAYPPDSFHKGADMSPTLLFNPCQILPQLSEHHTITRTRTPQRSVTQKNKLPAPSAHTNARKWARPAFAPRTPVAP